MVGNNQKLKKKKLLNKKFNYIIFYTIIFICILFINIGFSAFQNKLSIENISTLVRIDKDVRIAGINVDSISNGTSYYEEYSTFNISGSVSLDNIDFYVIYDVDVYNLGNVSMGIREASISNENGDYYLNFYGAAGNEGDDKFAAWNELDVNASMSLYKPN